MNSLNRIYRIGLLTFFAASLAGGCSESRGPAIPASQASPRSVATSLVRESSESGQLLLTGNLKSRRQAVIASKLPGYITFLAREEGDSVAAGEVLVRIDTRDIEAQTRQARSGEAFARAGEVQAEAAILTAQAGVSQAQAQLEAVNRQLKEAAAHAELARLEARRQEFLVSQGAVPRQRWEQAQTDDRVAQARLQAAQASVKASRASIAQSLGQLRQAQAQQTRSVAGVEQARASVASSSVNLDYGALRSPFAGVVIRKMAYPGEVASPGRPLLEIQDIQSLELSLDVPENLREQVQPHQLLNVEVPALKQSFAGRVRQIVSQVDPASRTFQARLKLENGHRKLLPGMFAKVRLKQPAQNVIWIERRSLVQRGGLDGVFIAASTAQFRVVKIGRLEKQRCEVLSGLSAGETIVDRPPQDLSDGTPLLGGGQ